MGAAVLTNGVGGDGGDCHGGRGTGGVGGWSDQGLSGHKVLKDNGLWLHCAARWGNGILLAFGPPLAGVAVSIGPAAGHYNSPFHKNG